MNALAFDTLSASKRLRDAGVDERMAEAIVEVVKQTADTPSIDHLATKADLESLEHKLSAQFGERLRQQGWALLGGVALIVTAATAIIKLVP